MTSRLLPARATDVVDAYLWIKPPGESNAYCSCTCFLTRTVHLSLPACDVFSGESDGCSSTTCPRFDASCASFSSLGGNPKPNPTEPHAPEAGVIYPYQLAQLARDSLSLSAATALYTAPPPAMPPPLPPPASPLRISLLGASSSSIMAQYVAEYAIDGNADTFIVTDSDVGNWLSVQIPTSTVVRSVAVYNIHNNVQFQNNLGTFEVYITSTPGVTTGGYKCGEATYRNPTGFDTEPYVVSCGDHFTGDRGFVTMRQTGLARYFIVSEVHIWGVQVSSLSPPSLLETSPPAPAPRISVPRATAPSVSTDQQPPSRPPLPSHNWTDAQAHAATIPQSPVFAPPPDTADSTAIRVIKESQGTKLEGRFDLMNIAFAGLAIFTIATVVTMAKARQHGPHRRLRLGESGGDGRLDGRGEPEPSQMVCDINEMVFEMHHAIASHQCETHDATCKMRRVDTNDMLGGSAVQSPLSEPPVGLHPQQLHGGEQTAAGPTLRSSNTVRGTSPSTEDSSWLTARPAMTVEEQEDEWQNRVWI